MEITIVHHRASNREISISLYEGISFSVSTSIFINDTSFSGWGIRSRWFKSQSSTEWGKVRSRDEWGMLSGSVLIPLCGILHQKQYQYMVLGVGQDSGSNSYLSDKRSDTKWFCPRMDQEWLFQPQKSIKEKADTLTYVCFIWTVDEQIPRHMCSSICVLDGKEGEWDQVHQSYLSVFLNCYSTMNQSKINSV